MLAQIPPTLPSALASAWLHPFASGDYTVAVFAISAGLIGFASCYWAAWMHARLANFRLAARRDEARLNADIRFRDVLLAGGEEAIAVLGSDLKEPFFSGAGRELLADGMKGGDAVMLASALDALLKAGTAFTLMARKPGGGTIAIRGNLLDRRAVVFLRDLGSADPSIDFQAALDAIAAPVWIRGRDLALRWANRAFLAATGAGGLQAALASDVVIAGSERDLAAAARDGADIADARRYAAIGGVRRALSLNFARLADASVAGSAVDVTEAARAEARVRLNPDAQADMLDRMPAAIAIFDKEQRLAGHNRAYAQMWNLPEAWLALHPTKSEILDRLREARSLPEQRDFAAWKRSHLQLFESNSPVEEFRHLADGRSIRVTVQPHLLGGLFFQFEDVSEQLRVESSFKMLGQVLRATLDTIDDGIAIFWPDGRLVLNNKAFSELWQLTEEELSGEPHLAKVAELSQARLGHDGIWSLVSAGVTSDEPERCAQWGKATRADGKIISVSMSRVPNGATVVTFADLTNVKRFEIASVEAAHVAA